MLDRQEPHLNRGWYGTTCRMRPAWRDTRHARPLDLWGSYNRRCRQAGRGDRKRHQRFAELAELMIGHGADVGGLRLQVGHHGDKILVTQLKFHQRKGDATIGTHAVSQDAGELRVGASPDARRRIGRQIR